MILYFLESESQKGCSSDSGIDSSPRIYFRADHFRFRLQRTSHLLEQYLVLERPDPTLELVVLAGEGPPPHGDEGEQGHEGEHEVRAAAHSEMFSKLCRGITELRKSLGKSC